MGLIFPGKFRFWTFQNGGLVEDLFFFNWVIFRFHVNFQACTLKNLRYSMTSGLFQPSCSPRSVWSQGISFGVHKCTANFCAYQSKGLRPKFGWEMMNMWWFQTFFIFTPKIGEDEPILTSIFFRWVETTNQMNMLFVRSNKFWSFCCLDDNWYVFSLPCLFPCCARYN